MYCPVCTNPDARFFLTVSGRDYWRCQYCQATFQDPAQLPTAAVEKAEYDQHDNQVHDAGYRHFLSRLTNPLCERLSPGARGLDFGCGPGPALAAMMSEAGFPTALYDPFYAPDASVLESTWDFVTCTEVVEHLHHPAVVFSRLNGLLKPGGWLGIMTQFQTDDARFANWHYRRDPTHVVFYREETLRYLADQYGWECTMPVRNVALMQKPATGRPLPLTPMPTGSCDPRDDP